MEKMRRMNIIPLKCRCRTGYNPGLMFFCESQSQERVKASIKALGEVSARVI